MLAMVLLPSLVAPAEFGGPVLASFWAQGISAGLECFFVFFGFVALQGVLMNVLSARMFARVSVYVQGILTGALLLAGLRSWSIREWPIDRIQRLPEFAAWAPPVWFAGLREVMLGDRSAFFTAMASRAWIGAAAAAGLAATLYILSCQRYQKLLAESPVPAVPRGRRSWTLAPLLSSGPEQEAALE